MLLSVSIFSSLVLIYVGYTSGKSAIKDAVMNQLTGLRSSKATQLKAYFQLLDNTLAVFSKDETMIRAAKELSQEFNKLTNKLDANCDKKLADHYAAFSRKVAENLSIKENAEMYYPNTSEACYLQYHYVINNPQPVGHKHLLTKSETDISGYAHVHAKHHPMLRSFVEKFKLYDLFLVNLNTGDIVYSVFKETDFATNLFSGPYRESNLAELVRKIKKSTDLQSAQLIDFARYRPSYFRRLAGRLCHGDTNSDR